MTKLTGPDLDNARWLRANRTHPDNYARANYRGCSPGSRAENLWHRISILLGDMPG